MKDIFSLVIALSPSSKGMCRMIIHSRHQSAKYGWDAVLTFLLDHKKRGGAHTHVHDYPGGPEYPGLKKQTS